MKNFLANVLFLVPLFLFSGWLISAYMEAKARPEIFSFPEEIPPVEAVVVPGASVYRSGKLSPVLLQRMEAGLELASARPGVKLVLSGHTIPDGYSETRAMHDHAIARGFPAEDVLIDDQGRSTFLTLLNCRNRFGLRRIAMVTQGYHLPRALYIARRLGLEAYGLRIGSTPAGRSDWNGREWLSRIKDFALVRIFRYFHPR